MADVTLSSAVRSSLLALQDTTKLINTTQDRLATGLRVANAVDDPVSFFQAKNLNDRGFDLTAKKDLIDQGVSSVEAALVGVEGIESIVRQIKGVATSLKSATGTQFTDLISQFNNLRAQIGTLTADTKFQDVNLIDGTGSDLTVSFSDQTSSLLTISSVNLAESGLGFGDAAEANSVSFNFAGLSGALVGTDTTGVSTTATAALTVTYQGSAQTLSNTGGAQTGIAFTYGTFTVNLQLGENTTGAQTINAGDILTLSAQTVANAGSAATFIAVAPSGVVGTAGAGSASNILENITSFITEGTSSTAEAVIVNLDAALTTLRSNAQTLGSNVALLQTRLDFTTDYVNKLEDGAAKLTLADINSEGANLLALQTRQQLGISALAFAGQAEQGVLSLFR
jgi:flagellin-like hook-associated protein FlgL